MTQTEELVRSALKEKAPALYRSLAASGELKQFVAVKAAEIVEQVHDLAMQIAENNGYNETDDPMKRVGIYNMAAALAREIVFAEMLEFPPDPTSLLNPDETSDSDQPT